MTDEDLKELVASLAIAQQKTDVQLDKVSKSITELTEQQKKTDAQLAKTDAQLAKTDAQLAKTDAQLAKTSAKVDRISDLIGNISNNHGDATEEFFYRSLLKNTVLGNMQFEAVDRNVQRNKGHLQDEFDLVLFNGDSIAVIEIKHKTHPNEIDKMLHKKLPNFRALYPNYKNLKLYGAIASMVSNDKLIAKAKEAGLFFLTQQGEHVVLANDEVRAFF